MVPRVSGRNSFIRVNSIANPHPPKISKILIGASRCPRTWCVAVPDGATELERLRDRNQGIAPPSNADLIAIIRAKDDLICQLKTAALETDRLRDRVEQLEQLVGVDRSLTSRLRTAFGLEPGVAQVMGMLLKRDFVTHDALYVVLYAARWRRRHRR